MTTETLTLSQFLLERLSEDEAKARHAGADAMIGHRWKHAPEDVYNEIQAATIANSRRVLATCKAHRAIVEYHGSEILGICQEYDGDSYPCRTLRALASIYVDHADFRAEWSL